MEPLLASRLGLLRKNSPDGEEFSCDNSGPSKDLKSSIELESDQIKSVDSNNEYVSLQLRIFRITLLLTFFIVLLTAIFVDWTSSISLFIGALSGILYFRLLARSIGALGKTTSSVSKVQLIIPVLMVLLVAKLPELNFIPALVGFLLYKPSLIIQSLIDSSS